FPRRGSYVQLFLEELEILRIAVVKLLGVTRRFVMKCFGWHSSGRDTRPKVSNVQNSAKLRGEIPKRLRQHRRIGKDRHKIRIAIPARHYMNMQVLNNSRPRRASEVHPDIKSIWSHHLFQGVLTFPGQF